MYSIPERFFYFAIAGFATIHVLASEAPAQGYSYYGQNARAFDETDQAVTSLPAFNDIGKNVYAIDNLADQMVFRYGWEARCKHNCPNAVALLDQLKQHAKLTNELIMAYRGKSETSFQQAAYEVNDSIRLLEALQKKAKVSESVSNMISQSIPMATYVVSNASQFTPDSGSNT